MNFPNYSSRFHFSTVCLCLVLLSLQPISVSATVLTFDISGSVDGDVLSHNYGDRVSSTTNGSFNYEEGNGFTRFVQVDYDSTSSDPAGYGTALWNSAGYGDLTGVAWGTGYPSTSRIIFTADAGYGVVLNSFDMAGWESDITASLLTVTLDGVVMDLSGSLIEGLMDDAKTPTHSSFDFTGVMAASEVIIEWADSWSIGIDNINFDQTVMASKAIPEPSSIGLLLLGLAGFSVLRKHQPY